MSVVINCGMSFGDEGKGGFVDYLSHDGSLIIKYNGGAHASHTVMSPQGLVHRFSQLGSGMFYPDSTTLLDSGFTMDPFALAVESREFAKKTGVSAQDVLDRVAVHDRCLTVTRLHRCLNRVEMEQTNALRGSVGTGVSTAAQIYEEYGIGLRFGDMLDGKAGDVLPALQEILQKRIEERPTAFSSQLEAEIASVSGRENLQRLLDEYKLLLDTYNIHRYSNTQERGEGKNVVLEGSQGLLLDKKYGFRPHTTFLDTTAMHGVELFPQAQVLGIVKAFCTRHGAGAFPTEDDRLSSLLDDANQEIGKYNGKIRSGWFDAVLLRYAQRVNQVSGLCLSCLDRLSGLSQLQICVAYDYLGTPGDDFDTLFQWQTEQGHVRIYDIQNVSDATYGYLAQCRPVYLSLPGWDAVFVAGVSQKLTETCHGYIDTVERLTGIPVVLASVAADRAGRMKFNRIKGEQI